MSPALRRLRKLEAQAALAKTWNNRAAIEELEQSVRRAKEMAAKATGRPCEHGPPQPPIPPEELRRMNIAEILNWPLVVRRRAEAAERARAESQYNEQTAPRVD